MIFTELNEYLSAGDICSKCCFGYVANTKSGIKRTYGCLRSPITYGSKSTMWWDISMANDCKPHISNSISDRILKCGNYKQFIIIGVHI